MSNFRIFHPGIMEDAVRIRSTSTFAEDTPVSNLVNGERYTRARLNATSSWIQVIDFELSSGTSQAADFWYGAVVDKLQSTISDFSFRGSDASYFAGENITSITAWYDAAYRYDLTPGGKIINWYDRSGNGRTLTQATDANRYSLIQSAAGLDNGLNGFPFFKSVASQMQPSAAFTLANALNAGRFTIWAVIKTGSDVTTFQKIFRGTGFHLTLAVESDLIKLTAHDSGGAKVVTRSANAEEVYLIRARHDGSAIKLSLNGGTEGSTACGSVADMSGTVTLGETSNPLLGYLAELILSNQDVGSAQTPIDDYLMAKWVNDVPYSDTYFNETGLRGPRTADYVASFTETDPFRYWWAVYTPSGMTDLYHSKSWGGVAFDMGLEADYEIERVQPDEIDFTYDSGARRLERTTRPIYRISLTWTGVTDAKVTSFQDIIARYPDNKTFALTTSDAYENHEILDNQRVIHCRLISAECQKIGGIDDYNIVRAEFQELIG